MLLTVEKGEEKIIIQAGRQKNGGFLEVALFLGLTEIITDRQILTDVHCYIAGAVLLLKLITI